jgi:3-methyladenine DNA glycosylase AlkD
MTDQEIVELLYKAHLGAANPARSAPMAAYMKNRHPFLGIAAPERQKLIKPVLPAFKKLGNHQQMAIVRHFWLLPQREFHYLALDLARACRRNWTADWLDMFVAMVTQQSWWDTVDTLATDMIGPYCLAHLPQRTDLMRALAKDPDMWLNRVAILHQLKYKSGTDIPLLIEIIDTCRNDKRFFIQKAIGWALRQQARLTPDLVVEYIDRSGISGLARREALKHLG